MTLEIGRDYINDRNVRFHRYNGSVVVQDLTNAGKRGKKVAEFRYILRPNLDNNAANQILGDTLDTIMLMGVTLVIGVIPICMTALHQPSICH